MKTIGLTPEFIKSFSEDVLIQGQYFSYDKLVQWLNKNKAIKNFTFETNTDIYEFRVNEKGVYIDNFTVNRKFLRSLFASFKEYLPKKSFYVFPEIIPYWESR